jgi:micrococcal nuclease
MSASHSGQPKILNYIAAIVVFAIAFEFLSNTNFLPKVINFDKASYNENSNDSFSDMAPQFAASDSYQLVRVIDGDTIEIIKNNINANINTDNAETNSSKLEKVRLIGVDTPETNDKRQEVKCFADKATVFTKSFFADNKNLYLELDNTQGEYDKYGRKLAYVFNQDGSMLNKALIQDGFAYEYTFDKPYKYQKLFKFHMKNAEDKKLGLWGDSCKAN